MKAIAYTAADKRLKILETPIPKIRKSTDVLVKVAYAGICGTDLHIIQGEFPCKQDSPFQLGHEISGVVFLKGEDVKNVNVGDRVSVDPNHGCSVCHFCHSGNPHYCKVGGINNTIGIFKNGGWAEYVLVPDSQIHKIPEKLTLEQAVLCEPLSCIAHGWDVIAPVTVGQDILIIGAGIIGNLWLINLHLQGHRRITVSEPNQSRLKLLKEKFEELDYVTPSELQSRFDANKDYLFDLVIDCSGNNKAIEQGFSVLKQGGKLCIFGVASPKAKISVSPFEIYMKEIQIVGVNINPFTFPKAIGLAESLGQKYLDYELLGIRTFPLEDYEKAIDCLKSGSISKAVFYFKSF